jgi:hypothetical protein
MLLIFSDCFQDVVLARIIDEATAANLNSMIHTNNATVRF